MRSQCERLCRRRKGTHQERHRRRFSHWREHSRGYFRYRRNFFCNLKEATRHLDSRYGQSITQSSASNSKRSADGSRWARQQSPIQRSSGGKPLVGTAPVDLTDHQASPCRRRPLAPYPTTSFLVVNGKTSTSYDLMCTG